jgi:hypothetical protein
MISDFWFIKCSITVTRSPSTFFCSFVMYILYTCVGRAGGEKGRCQSSVSVSSHFATTSSTASNCTSYTQVSLINILVLKHSGCTVVVMTYVAFYIISLACKSDLGWGLSVWWLGVTRSNVKQVITKSPRMRRMMRSREQRFSVISGSLLRKSQCM